eukprot:1975539-Prorocentrum_lima.AAC.1
MSYKCVTKKDQPWVIAQDQEMQRAMLIKWHIGSNEWWHTPGRAKRKEIWKEINQALEMPDI